MTVKKQNRRQFIQGTITTTAGLAAASSLGPFAYSATAQKGWQVLFDGKTLNGWHKNPTKIGHGTGGQWQVEDGTITGQQDPPGSGNGGILLTDEKFGDLELVIDMKPDWGVCSGLFVRGTNKGQCFQMMVDYHDAGNIGHLYGEGTTGFNTSAFSINGKYDNDKNLVGITTDRHKTARDVGLLHTCTPTEWVKAWKINDWNTAKVRVVGKYPRITTWINGLKVCDFDGETADTSKYDKEVINQTLGETGSIAVQVHGGTGWPNGAKCRWKNIRVRSLS